MAKRIAYIPDVKIEGTDGSPYYRIPGTDGFTQQPATSQVTKEGMLVVGPAPDYVPVQRLNPPWEYSQIAFLLDRIADEKYAEGEIGGMAQLLREDARGEIRRQRLEAPKRGYWEFSDDMGNRLMNVTMKPTGSLFPLMSNLAFCVAPYIRAVKDQAPAPVKAEPVAEAVQAPPNGAASAS